jgi:hypothetical protein
MPVGLGGGVAALGLGAFSVFFVFVFKESEWQPETAPELLEGEWVEHGDKSVHQ